MCPGVWFNFIRSLLKSRFGESSVRLILVTDAASRRVSVTAHNTSTMRLHTPVHLIRTAAPSRLPCKRVAALRGRATEVAAAAAAARNSQPTTLAEDAHEAGPSRVDEAQLRDPHVEQVPGGAGLHTSATGAGRSSPPPGATPPSLASAGRVLTCRTLTLPAEVSHTKVIGSWEGRGPTKLLTTVACFVKMCLP